MSVKLPNFLIIGAAKSGTTALFRYLEQHPQVFISEPKEPHFLAFDGESPHFCGPGDEVMMNTKVYTEFPRYESLFNAAGNAAAIGEGSVSTLYYPQSIGRIKKYMPDAKLIVLLRQPAERAWSAFSFMHMRVYEPCQDFREALRQEAQRISQNWHHIWHYQRQGMYYQQLKPYFDAFGRDQIRVYLFDDFRKNPQPVLRDCFDFLGVDASFVPGEEPSPHVSGMPKSRLLQAAVARAGTLRKMLKVFIPPRMRKAMHRKFEEMNLRKDKLDPQLRAELTNSFREDILQLQDLLDRDLTSWLKPKEQK